jgi:hypothetical protein
LKIRSLLVATVLTGGLALVVVACGTPRASELDQLD